MFLSGCEFCFPPANPAPGAGLCVFVCELRLFPANPGRGVRCMSSVAGCGFSPPIMSGAHGVWVWVRTLALEAQFLAGVLGCLCLCVRRVPVLCHHRLGGACLGSGFGVIPANFCWSFWCVCLSSDFASTPPILAGMLGCVCLFARPACTCQSWLGCAVCLFSRGFCFQAANPGYGVGICVFVCALRLYAANPD